MNKRRYIYVSADTNRVKKALEFRYRKCICIFISEFHKYLTIFDKQGKRVHLILFSWDCFYVNNLGDQIIE